MTLAPKSSLLRNNYHAHLTHTVFWRPTGALHQLDATRDARRVRNVPRSPGKKASPVSLAVDDFLMYFSIVVSLHFCWWEFILGTTIGAICIATALGTCLWCSPRLADKVASLPLVPVVVIMAIYIAVQAFVPAMNPSPRNSAGAC